ncbi:hypothetical protein FJQ54_12275 [Sandaracinobacter neustonicus]|uniref:Uncharacterized protein n=1 Tax=Sandaracinobacter neustonicus TaxID=1715348 RepID=A0A501XIT1_9SPHN|nr:circularly permuted type 2 ATP-grasp protein [Sandaracinobacter neustonicus]TPE60177.1 hypothetical protein FJQ54_12275 [Sandaracinobacter neustonicus]
MIPLAPAENRLRHYPADVDAGDLYRHAPPHVAEKWTAMANGLLALSAEAGSSAQELVARQVQELGFSFRITGDTEERSWPLTPMPLIIGAEEWSEVERGLVQRAELMERIAADIYGPQSLVQGGHLPAAVVTGSRYFARDMIGQRPRGDHYLHVYAADLARGPRGQWRILADRLKLATGAGYALENRLALSRSTGALLAGIHVRRLAGFFADLRAGIARDCGRESPRIALLTPGRFNQSYPEQAHLARYLGFPLVEGRDLTVSDDKLYVRTIAGPKRIDALWRWIDTNALDPLRFDSRSQLGVPDLFEAWTRGQLELANWPGVELLESQAFSAFLPALCQQLMGEAPILPNVATWWCGQTAEAEQVRARLDELQIVPAFGEAVEGISGQLPQPGAALSPAARAQLLDAMARRPMDYCGQEIVQLSTTPALVGDGFEPRPFTVRAFVARDGNGQWTVMPGGFARLSSSGALRSSLMGEGDLSADVCIVDEGPGRDQLPTLFHVSPPVRRGGGILASQAADNLYWFGRYVERAEATVRVVRSILGSSIDVDSLALRDQQVRGLLAQLLYLWNAVDEDSLELPMAQVCRLALLEQARPGGVSALLAAIRDIGLALRDRFASDFWRVASRPLPEIPNARGTVLQRGVWELLERFSALSGLIAEDMVRSPAWRFLDIGRRIERALAICRMLRQMERAESEADALSAMLDLCDSQISYRSRYLSSPAREPVLDLLLLDPENPRSLIFQLQALNGHLEALPTLAENGLPEAPQLASRAILASFAAMTADSIDDALLMQTEERLLALSEAVSLRYFLQFDRAKPVAGQFLA